MMVKALNPKLHPKSKVSKLSLPPSTFLDFIMGGYYIPYLRHFITFFLGLAGDFRDQEKEKL